nr:MAG TPA: hypothetical protein [Caudoviricetes sp.]
MLADSWSSLAIRAGEMLSTRRLLIGGRSDLVHVAAVRPDASGNEGHGHERDRDGPRDVEREHGGDSRGVGRQRHKGGEELGPVDPVTHSPISRSKAHSRLKVTRSKSPCMTDSSWPTTSKAELFNWSMMVSNESMRLRRSLAVCFSVALMSQHSLSSVVAVRWIGTPASAKRSKSLRDQRREPRSFFERTDCWTPMAAAMVS